MQDKTLLYRLWWLFKTNVIISCLAVGGGYMIIPLMKKPFVDNAKAFSFDELLEMSAVAQSAPGAIAVNLSAITGYRIAGLIGAVVSCVAAVLPPLLIMSAVAVCYQQVIHNQEIMIAAIAAIIIDVVYDMGKNVARNKEMLGVLTAVFVFVASFVFELNAVFLIVVSLVCYALIVWLKGRGK